MRRFRKQEKGQAAIEFLLVFAPWFFLIMLFISVLLILGSMMLNQAAVNRGAQQVAALGCLPNNIREEIDSRTYLGAANVEVSAIEPRADGNQTTNFNRSEYLDENGRIDAGESTAPGLPPCTTRAQTVPSGNYIFVQATYDQGVPLLGWLGIDASFPVEANALVISNSLEVDE